MDRANNADVELALAAAGSRSLQYRTFADARRSDTTEPRTSVATAFPLLAVALPEIAQQPVLAVGQTNPAPQEQSVSDEPTMGRGDLINETTAPRTSTIPAPASAPFASGATAGPAAVSLPDEKTAARSADTPLAAIFRLLRGQTKPSPAADRDSLDRLFRRL